MLPDSRGGGNLSTITHSRWSKKTDYDNATSSCLDSGLSFAPLHSGMSQAVHSGSCLTLTPTQASEMFGDEAEIDASIHITGGKPTKKKSQAAAILAGGGNEGDDLLRLRRYCDEVLENNKRCVGHQVLELCQFLKIRNRGLKFFLPVREMRSCELENESFSGSNSR